MEVGGTFLQLERKEIKWRRNIFTIVLSYVCPCHKLLLIPGSLQAFKRSRVVNNTCCSNPTTASEGEAVDEVDEDEEEEDWGRIQCKRRNLSRICNAQFDVPVESSC
jgi:hypothetical protein